MADVHVIGPDGKQYMLDDTELDAARQQGYKPLREIAMASHVMNQPQVVPQPEKPSIWESIGRGLAGMAGPYEGAVGRGNFTISPVTGGMVPMQSRDEFNQNLQAEELRSADAQKEHPIASMGASFFSPESLAMGAVGGMGQGGMQKFALRHAADNIEDFGLRAAIDAARPKLGDAAALYLGSDLGGMVGMPTLGRAVGALPWATRVATDPRVQYQTAKLLPKLGRTAGAAWDTAMTASGGD